MHEDVGDYIMGKFTLWKNALESSADRRVSDAAKTVKPSGSTDVQFSYAKGANDSKSPDKSIRHKTCDRKCKSPTILMEFAWTQDSDDLEDKATAYSEFVFSGCKSPLRELATVNHVCSSVSLPFFPYTP